jgi:hypothetical protein
VTAGNVEFFVAHDVDEHTFATRRTHGARRGPQPKPIASMVTVAMSEPRTSASGQYGEASGPSRPPTCALLVLHHRRAAPALDRTDRRGCHRVVRNRSDDQHGTGCLARAGSVGGRTPKPVRPVRLGPEVGRPLCRRRSRGVGHHEPRTDGCDRRENYRGLSSTPAPSTSRRDDRSGGPLSERRQQMDVGERRGCRLFLGRRRWVRSSSGCVRRDRWAGEPASACREPDGGVDVEGVAVGPDAAEAPSGVGGVVDGVCGWLVRR